MSNQVLASNVRLVDNVPGAGGGVITTQDESVQRLPKWGIDVGGSSISNSVKAANSKLAQMLRTREEDEALLQIGKRKIKDQAAREADYGGRVKKAKRWSQKADFSYPSPLVDRPRTAAGSTSFHFSYTTVSKEGSPEVRGKPMANFGGANRVPGADHAAYVERDGAAEMSRGAEHAQYVERPGAIEQSARERTLGDDIGEGQPLRPQPVEPALQVKAEPVDLTRRPDDRSAQTGDQPQDLSAPNERVDERHKVEDPTLFPVSESFAPTKPGTAKASYEDWDALITKIARHRVPIAKEMDAFAKVHYTVPMLAGDDAALISNDRFAARSATRLAAIFEQQDHEIGRLIRWIEKNGQDPTALIIENRSARIDKATDSVASLLNAWRSSERVKNALRAENDRREKLAGVVDRAKATQNETPERSGVSLASPASTAASNQARHAELARMYPEPADGRMPQTRLFIKLLREDASPEEIKKAGEAISLAPVAREDVYRHKVELALAYDQAMDDDYLYVYRIQQNYRGRN